MHRAGDRIGTYELVQPLGAGGFGSVWLAHAPGRDRDVAIKILHRDMLDMPSKDRGPSVVDRFLAEARIIARLDHPGLVQIYELIDDREDGTVAYVMDKLEGCDLTKIDESLDLETLLDIFAEVADTLTFLHAQGVIHRDVTPRNIFVCDPEQGQARLCRVKLLDFGTAKELYATQRLAQTGTGVLLGALRSMAPESFLPKTVPTPAIDQWGLGVAMYAVLTGRAPFDNVSLAELVRQIEQDAPAPMTLMAHFGATEAPPELQRIVFRLLAKRPEDRFGSIQEAAIAIREVTRELEAARAMTVFDPMRATTEPAATPSSMNLSPQLKLAQAMVSRRRMVAIPAMPEALEVHTLREPSEETIPAPPPTLRRELNPVMTLPAGPAALAAATAARKQASSIELEAIDPIDGVTARLTGPPVRTQSPSRAAPRRKTTTLPPTYVREAPELSLDSADLRPTIELEPAPDFLPEGATPLEMLQPITVPPPSTATMRAIQELSAISTPPLDPGNVRAILVGTLMSPPPLLPAKPRWPSWLKSAAVIALMLAATAIGWFVRDLAARFGFN